MTTDQQRQAFEAAAKKIAQHFDYPWEEMPEPGKESIRALAQHVLEAAQPRVIDKSELKRLVCQVFGEDFQIVQMSKVGAGS